MITVELKIEGENKCFLTVQDNGVGIHKSTDEGANNSLGMELVSALAKQLNGDLMINVSQGTAITIRFPFKSPRDRS